MAIVYPNVPAPIQDLLETVWTDAADAYAAIVERLNRHRAVEVSTWRTTTVRIHIAPEHDVLVSGYNSRDTDFVRERATFRYDLTVPGYSYIEHQGCVVWEYEYNGYHDSDFFAIVYDPITNALKTEEYASTRYGGGGSAKVDILPEYLERIRARESMREYYRNLLEQSEAQQKPKLKRGVSAIFTEAYAPRKYPVKFAVGGKVQVHATGDGQYGSWALCVPDGVEPQRDANERITNGYFIPSHKLEAVGADEADITFDFEYAYDVAMNVQSRPEWRLMAARYLARRG